MTTFYDFQFNLNEWVLLGAILGLYIVVFVLPRQYPMSMGILLVLFGVFFGWLFDHSLAIEPFNYYDVNDSSNYEWSDVITYILYGPFSYFFIYFYDRWRVKGIWNMLYIMVWVGIAILCEYLANLSGIFHYREHYTIIYSIPIYLYLQTVFLFVYVKFLKKSAF